jgi:hypothetical protein
MLDARYSILDPLNRPLKKQHANLRFCCIEYRVSSIEYRVSSIEHRASSIEHPASSIQKNPGLSARVVVD